jgi:hypothetical protein
MSCRHDADYDPDISFNRAEAFDAIERTDKAIRDLKASSENDRRAFAVLLLLKKRR